MFRFWYTLPCLAGGSTEARAGKLESLQVEDGGWEVMMLKRAADCCGQERVKKEERTTGETRRVEEEGADACTNDRRPTSTRRITTPSSI